MSAPALVEELREKIRKLEAQPRQWVLALRTGHEALDALGAFRLGSGVELNGEDGSGRATIALSLVAAAGRERRLSAWVDGPRELYPPAALAQGVALERLLVVRPPNPQQLVWSAVQLLRSGAFSCVVLDVSHTPVRLTMTDAKKLLDASRTGGSLAVILTSSTAPAQGLVRLSLESQPPPVESLGAGRTLQVVRSEPMAEQTLCVAGIEVKTPHGRQLAVPRRPVLARRLPRPWDPPPWHPVVASESLRRPKKNHQRDGYPMGWGRPGRDGPLTLPPARAWR